ncbi:MAG TPA: hemerythrin domain-containing protein [Rhodanobacteraceae bacterium]|nr:hemerythrin domain-containing protein [Rhodanobacteraceae bacterium]
MDAMPPSRLITAQHHEIDQGIKAAVDGTGSPAKLGAALALLRHHLYIEEEVLFPPLAKTGLTMPVFVMKREHGQMWPLIEQLDADAKAAKPLAALHEPARQLFQLLQMHNPKEEQIVYTAADRLATQQGDGALVHALETVRDPAGWICAMAPKPGSVGQPPGFAPPIFGRH